jgi:hypothetical protein
VHLGLFFSFVTYTQSVGFLGRGISPTQGHYLHKHRISEHRQPYLEWHSNPRSQCSNGRRRFMPDRAATVIGWRVVTLLTYGENSRFFPLYPLLGSDLEKAGSHGNESRSNSRRSVGTSVFYVVRAQML